MIKFNRSEKISLPAGMQMSQTISKTQRIIPILDYNCSEIKITSESKIFDISSSSSNYFYTYDSLTNYQANYTTINGESGILLGSNIEMSNGVMQVWRAKSITLQNIDSTLFDLPADYKVYSMAEYNQKLETDKSFRKEIAKEFGISKWKTFFDILLEVTPEILSLTSDIINSATNENSPTPQMEVSIEKENRINDHLDKEVQNSIDRNQKNSEYYFKYYTSLADQEENEANYYMQEYEKSKDIEALKKANLCTSRAKNYREKAEIWK
jgi:hypothetical protein